MSETWAAFAADPDAAPDLVATWALIETCGEASPALALRLIAHHLASPWAIGPWPRALDPLLAVPGVIELWRASPARDAIGLGLAMMGHLDAAEVAPAMVDAYVAAIAAAIDPSADADGDDSAGRAIALACADGARLDAAFGARILAAIAPDARLPVALVAWLARGERDAVARVRLELRAADLDGPRPAIAPADRATLAAILDDPAALGDDDALAAGAAARALDLALPVATWDGLARAAHLARTEDLDEPAIEVVRALRRASPARRAQLAAQVPAFPWRVIAEASPPRTTVAAPLRAALDEAWHRLHADDLAQLPRSYGARVLAALDPGAPCEFVADDAIAAVRAARPDLAGAGRLAQLGPLPMRGARDQRRARIARLCELRAPEVVIAPDLERLRFAEREREPEDWSAACVYPHDPRTAGLARRLHLAVQVGERLLPRWRAAFPGDDLAPQLLEDLARLARGERRLHADLGVRVEARDDPSPAWAIAQYLFAVAEHHDGAPTLTLQDAPLDLAQRALMPDGFGAPAGADERLGFWRWWLGEAVPAATTS